MCVSAIETESVALILFDGSCGLGFVHEKIRMLTVSNIVNCFRLTFCYLIFAILIISEKTPAAVTLAPAP